MKNITFNDLKKLVSEARGPVEKFYVVAERDNPQLGTYLMNVYVGKKRINKNSISCTFDYYGSPKTLKFTLGVSRDNYARHSCINGDNSIYGSVYYFGFDTIEDARKYLEGEWADSRKLPEMLAKLNKDNLTTEAKRYARDCYAINIRDYHTGMHNLYTGTEDTMYKLEEIIKRIDHIVHYKDGTAEELEDLYDEINTYDYDVLEEIDWRKIDNNNDYYEPFSEKTYHIINNRSYDMW